MYAIILLYFIILTNLYCTKTLNIVLSFVIDVHFVMVVLLVFSKMWRFPYPFGSCNPVWIYGRKINDDDDDDKPPFAISECVGHFFLEAKSSVTSFFQMS